MKYIIFPSIALLFCSSIFAQDSASTSELPSIIDTISTIEDTIRNKKGQILQEVIVTANQQKAPVSVGKSGIKPMDLPQAIQVINNQTIVNQQINSMSDLLKNTNGVYIMGTSGGYQEEIASRGFALSSSNTFKNGIRYFNGMATEMSGIEKAEFLKGSAAILYGNVSAGGILNLVTKKPKFDFGGEVGFRFGSFGAIKPTFDLYGSLNKKKTVGFRINGSYEKADSFRDYVSSERYYVNPSLQIKINNKTNFLIEGDYLNDTRTPDFGAGIINYTVVEIPRSRFLGVTWGHYDSQQAATTATLTHEFNNNWNFTFVNSVRFFQTDLFSNTRPNSGTNGTIKPNGDWNRSIQRAESKDNYFIQQFDLKGSFNTGSINHKLLVGYDTERFKTLTKAYTNFNNFDTINIFQDYDATKEKAAPTLTKNTQTTAPISRYGTYVQDLMSITDQFKLLAGVRYTFQNTQSDVLNYKTNTTAITKNKDHAFSPRLGLIYQPSSNQTLFATYSNSFEVNTGQDLTGNALKPSIVDQFELGIKNKLFSDRLFLNVTAYQITNDSFYQQSLSNGNTYSYIKVLAGEVRSQGIEVDVISNPVKGLSILAGYSFNETKYVDSDYFIEGSQLKYNPKNTANLNGNFQFESGKLKGLNIGVINTYFGTRYAGRPTRVVVPGDTRKLIYLSDFIQVDATLGYTLNKFAIRSKLSNIFNALNYNVHDDNSVNPIAPRNYSVAVNYTF